MNINWVYFDPPVFYFLYLHEITYQGQNQVVLRGLFLGPAINFLPPSPSGVDYSIIRTFDLNSRIVKTLLGFKDLGGTFLVVQWVRLHAPNAGGLGSIPGLGTRSHMHATTKIPHAPTKTWRSRINK